MVTEFSKALNKKLSIRKPAVEENDPCLSYLPWADAGKAFSHPLKLSQGSQGSSLPKVQTVRGCIVCTELFNNNEL